MDLPVERNAGWSSGELLSVALVLAATVTLVVNFVIAVPVSLVAAIASARGARASKDHRALHLVTLSLSLVLFAASVIMVFVLLPAGSLPQIDTTVVPAS
ncbi:hypothetical protein GCM10009541_15610 [Micromonospora gifhornensis]|uniref:DUF4190 domain-containing protein n=1 Tax=Micromonospora gifhornensis TaxID=84594 RepID=A0ABQ4IF59_9ACTN|nr:hypothetical protein Vgi01_32330 [Micromonospora gifhornensis]